MKRAHIAVLLATGLLLVGRAGHAAASDVYVSQAGGGAGSSCSNAESVEFFNAVGNWGMGAAQIGAGTTVHLCGSITSDLMFQGSGSSGTPVVLDGTSATLSSHVVVGAVSYWTVSGVTWSTTFPTDGSTPLAIKGGNNGLIVGNTLDVASPSPTLFLQQSSNASALSHDIVIRNNFLRTSATYTDAQTDLLDTEGSYNVTVEGNYFEMRSQNNDQHDDCIQSWEKGGASAGPPHDWTIRNNEFVMNTTATQNKSWHMIEQMAPGTVSIYGNVYVGLAGAGGANGIVFDSNESGMVADVYGNTIVEKAGGPNNLFNLSGSGTYKLRDNIVYSTDSGNALTGGAAGLTRDHNLWYGANVPSCEATEICGNNPLFGNYASNDFSLASGSPASGAGVNLGASYGLFPIAKTTWPNPALGNRPASGAWDIGAYNACAAGCDPTDGGDGGGGTDAGAPVTTDASTPPGSEGAPEAGADDGGSMDGAAPGIGADAAAPGVGGGAGSGASGGGAPEGGSADAGGCRMSRTRPPSSGPAAAALTLFCLTWLRRDRHKRRT